MGKEPSSARPWPLDNKSDNIYVKAVTMVIDAMLFSKEQYEEEKDADETINPSKIFPGFFRCTAKDAFAYTKKLIDNFDKLDNKTLNDIAKETINHTTLTVDDVLHDSLRPVYWQR